MLFEYRDPRFWEKFQASNWRPRLPTVIRNPFKEPLFTEAMVLRAMKAFQAGLEGGDERFRYTFALGKSRTTARSALRDLFRRESESMETLERNCSRAFPGRSFGLMVNNLQSLEPELWSGVTAFLQDAHRWIDFPIARAIVDLFFGNYPSSFLGLHKDTQEIFGFVVRGEKVILAWPFEYFVSRVEEITSAARYYQMQAPVDYRKYRKDALVLRARPGDIIYWPSDYWHIAEATPRDFSSMLSLGLFPAHAAPEREKELGHFREKLLKGTGTYLPRERSSLRSQAMTEALVGDTGSRRLRWATGFSFEFGCPVLENFPRLSGETRGTAKIVKKSTSLLLWSVDSDRRRIVVSVNGYSVSLPYSRKASSLLQRLAHGKTVGVEKPSEVKRRAGSELVSTYWDKKGRLKTRQIPARATNEAALIDWLLWVRAVDTIE